MSILSLPHAVFLYDTNGNPVTLASGSLLTTASQGVVVYGKDDNNISRNFKIDTSGNLIISGAVAVTSFSGTQTVTGTVSVNNFPATQVVQDSYSSGQVLADQTGANNVLTFTFSSAVQLVYIFARTVLGGTTSRADPFGGTPSSTLGIPCDDGVPQTILITTSSVKVYAPTGVVVTVWGFRY